MQSDAHHRPGFAARLSQRLVAGPVAAIVSQCIHWTVAPSSGTLEVEFGVRRARGGV